ncbi:hypothetical protein LNQ82_00105 [Conchiformibius steedae DSM 2580]|uniref:DUF883 family protein n=1 Tax=Conchiformibius steedae DSM 2580 TaxID=1121352 RepID=A0AAE9HT40_9NEIS|nr:hypothetical protein [Conchiformibius steedae]QMT32979.1 hypothetical protein H3L98_07655 [Conchiformibius steedae]URD67602.1 hypothetical protein LNQ82_00105 [Conchiformibius steedae DSM 2580]
MKPDSQPNTLPVPVQTQQQSAKQQGDWCNKLNALKQEAQKQLQPHAQRADRLIKEKPYHAVGIAALFGLLMGTLFKKRRK